MSTFPTLDRTPREEQSREADQRVEAWTPPTTLPSPSPRPGLVHRWIRTSAAGTGDPINVANSFREGWTPVTAAEYPELKILSDPGTRWPDGIEVGGLLLCCAPAESQARRSEHYQRMVKDQVRSLNDQFIGEQDPRMRTMYREHASTVSRGFGPNARGARNPADET